MDEKPKAIETEYMGCRFRSRLEARWAVFFQTLGIQWQYEPEGFQVDYGNDEVVRYLPDFYLPQVRSCYGEGERGLYVEVKGSDEQLLADRQRLGIMIDYHNTPVSKGLLLLGDVPHLDERSFATHCLCYWDKGVACAQVGFRAWKIGEVLLYPEPHGWFDGMTSDELPNEATCQPTIWELTARRGAMTWFPSFKPHVHSAYAAARSARFEHGEKP